MPRTVDEVKTEMAREKEAGAPPMGSKMRALRAELHEVDPSLAPKPKKSGPKKVEVEAPKLAPEQLFQTPEWLFIEKACGELDLDLTKGVTTDLVKKIYNQVTAKVMAWRVMRSIVGDIGIGQPWPQWSKLGRNSSTGKKLEDEPEADPAPEAPAPPPPVPQEDPVRAGSPSAADIISHVTGGDPRMGLLSEVGTRAEREIPAAAP